MILLNIAELKGHLGEYISRAEKGEEIGVCRRNRIVAKLQPVATPHKNRTRLGTGRGTVVIRGDLTEPLIPEESWYMHQADKQ